jgi:beta-mannosidase
MTEDQLQTGRETAGVEQVADRGDNGDRIDLNGTWRLGWRNGRRRMSADPISVGADETLFVDAVVPGEVHLDLIRAGVIDDPSLALNAWAAQWVDDCIWWYRRTFDVPSRALGARAWLCLKEVDLIARVFLNGQLVGTHCNAFRPLRIDVTGHLHEGTNQLAIELDSGGFEDHMGRERSDRNLRRREWLRKPQYQFGWDWSTRYLNVGLSGDVYIEFTDRPFIVRQLVPLIDVAPDLGRAVVRARVVVEGLRSEPADAILTATIAGATAERPITLREGEHVHEVRLEVEEPELWWPAGHGDQKLHKLAVELTAEGVDEQVRAMIGFRRVDVNQDTHPDGGQYFVVRVNNRPIFCKGANLAPLDMIPARIEHDRYEALVARAREAHFNFIRVNGTGLYERDIFYDLCDRHGILVFQDFTFSCSQYPATDERFLEEIEAEARHQVRRLAVHPSLVIWCGNNEIEWLFWDRDRDRPAALPDRHLYHLVLPEIVRAEDPTRFYLPSSPWSPDGVYPNADEVGDQHPWSVGMGSRFGTTGWDIRDYRTMTCRFADEGGVLGPPALPTIEACLPEGQRHRRSIAWYAHDNVVSSARPSLSDKMLFELTGLDASLMSVEEYAYWGGLIQGEGLREFVENFRRRMFKSAAACFWSFNDCWPTTRGWTIMDYYLRRAPAFWAVRRAMAPVHVVVAQEDDLVNIYGINDTPVAITGELDSGFFSTKGDIHKREAARVTLSANTATVLRSLSGWHGEAEESIAFALLRRPGELDSRSRLILPTFRELRWEPPNVSMQLANGQLTFESDRFVWGVCLDLSGERALADNFFDVWPGMPYTLPWRDDDPPTILRCGNL